MSNKAIRAAIETRLADWAASFDYPVAWENAPFTPTAGQIWLRCFLLPAQTRSDDLTGEHRSYVGVAQIDALVPSGTGPGVGAALVGELEDLFPASTYLEGDGVSVLIQTPVSVGPALSDESWWVMPCSFTYRVDSVF